MFLMCKIYSFENEKNKLLINLKEIIVSIFLLDKEVEEKNNEINDFFTRNFNYNEISQLNNNFKIIQFKKLFECVYSFYKNKNSNLDELPLRKILNPHLYVSQRRNNGERIIIVPCVSFLFPVYRFKLILFYSGSVKVSRTSTVVLESLFSASCQAMSSPTWASSGTSYYSGRSNESRANKAVTLSWL